MSPYARIACCVDRDDMAEVVLREGMRIAGGDAGLVEVVHVIAPPHTVVGGPFAYVAPVVEMRDESEEWLRSVVASTPGITPVLLDGWPAREVCAWADANGVDLIVAAADRGLIERAILGGFATYIAYHATCSVLLVHRPDRNPHHGEELAGAGGGETER